MNVIEVNDRALNVSNRLNGFLGDLVGSIFQPQNNDQTDQLVNELYFKNQELEKAKTTTTYSMIAAGIFGITAAYLGYKQFKK